MSDSDSDDRPAYSRRKHIGERSGVIYFDDSVDEYLTSESEDEDDSFGHLRTCRLRSWI